MLRRVGDASGRIPSIEIINTGALRSCAQGSSAAKTRNRARNAFMSLEQQL